MWYRRCMANIKVSDTTRDELMELAHEHPRGKLSMDKTIQGLIAEYRRVQRDRLRKITEDEEFMARIDAARREPLEEGHSTADVLAVLAERQKAKSA
jgi:hypothetical protein